MKVKVLLGYLVIMLIKLTPICIFQKERERMEVKRRSKGEHAARTKGHPFSLTSPLSLPLLPHPPTLLSSLLPLLLYSLYRFHYLKERVHVAENQVVEEAIGGRVHLEFIFVHATVLNRK